MKLIPAKGSFLLHGEMTKNNKHGETDIKENKTKQEKKLELHSSGKQMFSTRDGGSWVCGEGTKKEKELSKRGGGIRRKVKYMIAPNRKKRDKINCRLNSSGVTSISRVSKIRERNTTRKGKSFAFFQKP